MTVSRTGGNDYSDRLPFAAERSVVGTAQLCDETLFHSYYREWARRMTQA
jgi:benzoate/toluate 1,2-dioxygenase alpha subunit